MAVIGNNLSAFATALAPHGQAVTPHSPAKWCVMSVISVGMSLQQPLFDVAPVADDVAPIEAVKKNGGVQVRTLAIIAAALIILNSVLIGMVVHEYTKAAPVMQSANRVMSNAQEFLDVSSRVLHGSIPRSVNALLQSDYSTIASTTSKLSQSLQDLFDTSSDYYMLGVAKYSALVTSIAGKIGTLRPSFPPFTRPSDDQGLVNLLSYATQWATQQLDRSELQGTANACVHWLDSALNIDWSASYTWGHDGQYGSYNANGAKNAASTVYQYCDRISRLPPSGELAADVTVDAAAEVAPEELATIPTDVEVSAIAMRLRKMIAANQQV